MAHIWGGIILGSRTDLHVQSVTMTCYIYRDLILEQYVRLFRGAMGAEFLFMDDNARPHRANIVDDCLHSEDITRMDCQVYSPNLIPLEHVWYMLGRRIEARQTPPTFLPELRKAWRVVCRLEGGQTQAEVAQTIGVSQSVISRIWNNFLETGIPGRRPGQCRKRATTPKEDLYLVLTARRHRNMNATLLQQHLRSATDTTVSTQTVRNRLHCVDLYARRPMSRFSVHPDKRRIFIWRHRGSRNNPAFMHESVKFGGGSVDGCTDLYIIRAGPLIAHRYRDEIFRPNVASYAAAIGKAFILMDDNFRPHRANLVEDFLFVEGIVRME
ncbi:transposable element Tcb2 transposase [Trichonephila clavipes]|nr:transposable element Tcb2 transposase [Trichonephila clavipes]